MSNQHKTDRPGAQDFRNKAGELGEDLSEMATMAADAGRDQIGKLNNAATKNYNDAKEHLASSVLKGNEMSNQHKTDRTSAQAFRSKAGELGEDLSEMATMAADAGRDQIGKLSNAATKNYNDAKEHLGKWEDSMEAYVREHPVKSLLIAAGAGVVLSFLWRHR